MKKVLSVLLVALLLLSVVACGGTQSSTPDPQSSDAPAGELSPVATDLIKFADNVDVSKVKVGMIFLHDPNASTYDSNFHKAAKEVQEALGMTDDQFIMKWDIPEEGSKCYDTACEMVDAGCNFIFADSFGHESNIKLAAAEFPEVQFGHATGTQSIVINQPNYHNAFASIYEGRYLAGIAAGMKLNQMIEEGKITADQAKMGYVGAWPYAEVKSGYTSFFLGARSVCPSATMEVVFTNSWFDIALEKEGALTLINDGCVLISQHADSEGAPKACEEKGVPNVAYNISTIPLGPTTAIISSKINWAPYFDMCIKCVATGTAIPADWCGSFATGSVELTELNEVAAAPGTADAIESAKKGLLTGTVNVFDTAKFTVEGKTLETYLADVLDTGDFTGETEVVKDGLFKESYYRSAPYFDILIDGITLK